MAGIWLYHMSAILCQYGRYMVIPYCFHIDTIWQPCGLVICLSYDINMAAILFIHIAAISIPYGRHMVQPYDSHTDTIWQLYGCTI